MYTLLTIMVPWTAGFVFLSFTALKNSPLHVATRLGLGYFFGIFLLYALFSLFILRYSISSSLEISLAILMLVTLGLAIFNYRNRVSSTPVEGTSRFPPLWIVFLGTLCLLHFVCASVEITHRPTFPWDAWSNWMFRAKAWFLAGEISPMIEATTQLTKIPSNTYSVAGAHYPNFLPVTAVWTATALGGWSETLVNLPTLVCGVGVALSVYGLARDHEASPEIAGSVAYLVVSTPLFGAHLSLAGMADIWMTAYAGLGFIAITTGLMRKASRTVVIGLALVAASTQIKVEGTVWLVGALLLVSMVARPRISITLAGVLIVVAGLAMVSGFTYVEIPVLGKLGVSADRVSIPFIGSYALQSYTLGDDYLSNFFVGGSWHLLWPGLLGAALMCLIRFTQRESLITLAFYAVFFAMQIGIFFFTENGAWADDWTAINRLPLHFLPALAFSLAMILTVSAREFATASGIEPVGSKDIDVTRWSKRSLIPVTLSFALLLAALALVGMLNEPDTKGTQFVRKGSQLVTIAGDTRRKEDGLDVLGFSNNVAILSTGPIQIEAKQLELLSIEITGTNRLPATLFWRQEGRSDLHNAGLADINVNFFDLRQQEGWTGNVTEIGIVLYDDGGQISIGSLTLQPRTLAALSQKLIGDWTWLSDWNLRSVNWIPAGRKDSLVALPLFATGWLVIAVLILALYVPRRHLAVAAFSSFLLIWISLDVRWLINRTYMASRTIESYEFGSSQPLDFGFDSIILDAVDKALCRRNEESRGTCTTGEHRMLVITSASAEDMRFQTLRAKYHALPTSAQVHRGDVGALRLANPNDILVLKQRFGADQDVTKSSAAYIAELKSEVKSTPYIAWETDNAFLISWRQTLLVP